MASSSTPHSASKRSARRKTLGAGRDRFGPLEVPGFALSTLPLSALPPLLDRSATSAAPAAGPETRTTATPARPPPDERANMVSEALTLRSACYPPVTVEGPGPLLVHGEEEILVRLGGPQLVQQELHGVDRPIGIRIRRRTHILASSPRSTSCSSFRVPDAPISIAG